MTITEILVQSGTANSKSEARRLVAQGGVRVDDVKVIDCDVDIDYNCIVRVGVSKVIVYFPEDGEIKTQ